MKRILITGAGSYLGRSLRDYLGQWPERYQVEAVSVRGDSWKALRFQGYDVIYHTAALVHSEQNKQDPRLAESYDRVNACLPVALAEKARSEGVGQFIFLSTGHTRKFNIIITRRIDHQNLFCLWIDSHKHIHIASA